MPDHTSYGASAVVAPDGRVVRTARQLFEDLLIAEIDLNSPAPVDRWASVTQTFSAS
ncbi:MAG: hypothetical protein LC791_11255 [Acidobacteria bacterium]|nr:hypothetical protein [Acidobacteriota bacterium]